MMARRDLVPKEKPRTRGLNRWIPEALEVSGLTHPSVNSVPNTLASPRVAFGMVMVKSELCELTWKSVPPPVRAVACRRAPQRHQRRGDRVLHQNSLQLHHDCAFRDSWSGHTSFAGILGDPLPCCPTALVGTSLILVDRDREPSASGAHEGIAHETL